MSDVYSMSRSDKYAAFDLFVTDDVGSSDVFKRAEMLLNNTEVPHAAEKAIGSAIKRAAISGEAYAARAVGKFYYIKAGDFKKYTKSKRHINKTADGVEIDIDFRGYHIPLIRFGARLTASGHYRVKVKKGSTGEMLKHVFRAEVGTHGHIGLYERLTSKRFPIEEKLGPSAPQMMDTNDDVAQAIGDKVRDTFEQRLDHEILAVLNGWRT